MFTEAVNQSIIQTELDTVFFQNFDYDATEPGIATARTGDLFKVVTTTHGYYIGSVNGGPGLWQRTGETQTVPTTTPRVTNKYSIQIVDWTINMPLSKDMFDDNMHGVLAEEVRQMALNARVTQDFNAFGLFRGAFTTTLTADGVSFINSAHPLIQGGTTSNLITGALSVSTFNDATTALRKQVNQANIMLGGVPKFLLVPPELYQTAVQITESALVPDSGNNAVNVFSVKFGVYVYQSPYLSLQPDGTGSATAWFVLTRNHSVSRVIRQGVETFLTPWGYSNNRTYNYQGNYREAYFVPDYCGAVGSTG